MMIAAMMVTALVLVVLLVLTIGRINLKFQFRKQVKKLFSLSSDVPNQVYQVAQLIDLPEPAQRYFKHVLRDGQPYISYVSITHAGQFKPGLNKDWVNITGEQYATTQTPGFIWKGSTAMFIARDSYIASTGRLSVSLFSLLQVVDGHGPQYDSGELLRWLGESVLYPTNLLPSKRLSWVGIDANTAKVTFDYQGMSLYFKLIVNTLGEITEMQTERYMDAQRLEQWVIKPTNYQLMNNILVPTQYEVLWRLANGDIPYARFNIMSVKYSKPPCWSSFATRTSKPPFSQASTLCEH